MLTSVELTVQLPGGKKESLRIPHGQNLRVALLENEYSPYQGRLPLVNCKGMGVCGTCKVYVKEKNQLWERRSCQLRCYKDLEIALR